MKSKNPYVILQKGIKSFLIVNWRVLYLIKSFLIYIIDMYKKYLSPFLPNRCRFYPTCSQYAREAILKYGTIKGLFLCTKRILRCNPFCTGGYDPVP